MAEGKELRELAELVGRQAAGLDVWKSAELHVIEVMLRERLTLLGIQPTPELAAGLMAVAQLLSESAPEFGGDARDTLADVAVLGLATTPGLTPEVFGRPSTRRLTASTRDRRVGHRPLQRTKRSATVVWGAPWWASS